MEHRKPPGVTWESWVDKQIREGHEQGAFDDLPGAGKPIEGLDQARDEDWWIKEKLKREDISYLPPTLAIRKRVEDARRAIAVAHTEAAVRAIVTEINHEIWRVNALGSDGPPSTVVRFDEDETVARWQSEPRQIDEPGVESQRGESADDRTLQSPAAAPRWWHRAVFSRWIRR